jgi:hypothetical protein
VPTRTPDEEAVAAIWRSLLGRADVGLHDDFFAVGVVARIRQAFGVHVPVTDFLESPTVAALASAVAARRPAEPAAINPRPPDAEPVLSFEQERLWLENKLLPGSAYNLHGRRHVTGPLARSWLATRPCGRGSRPCRAVRFRSWTTRTKPGGSASRT